MNCKHCEEIRRDQQAVVDEFGDDEYLGLYVTKAKVQTPMSIEVGKRTNGWFSHSTAKDVAECACDCHTPARIVGKLPPLAAAS